MPANKVKRNEMYLQGNSTYSPGLRKHQNIEEFLTTKMRKSHKGCMKQRFIPSFCALVRSNRRFVCGSFFFKNV
jgi:hypothetical protein